MSYHKRDQSLCRLMVSKCFHYLSNSMSKPLTLDIHDKEERIPVARMRQSWPSEPCSYQRMKRKKMVSVQYESHNEKRADQQHI